VGTTFANANSTVYDFGTFDVVNFGGMDFAVCRFGDSGTSAFDAGVAGNDVALMAIPEPNSMAMLAGSLGMALGLQRFRRRRRS
jgi:hypothetical protein